MGKLGVREKSLIHQVNTPPPGGTVTAVTGVSPISSSGGSTPAISLNNTAVTPASYGDATHVATFTVDAKGRLTAAANVAITGTIASARTIAMTGDVAWSVSFDGSANVTAAGTLANSGVTAGTYQNATVTVNSKGIVTNVAAGDAPYIRARLATATALPANTYLNGVAGVGATLTGVLTGVLTVDGKTTALNDVILVKNEATQANNGAYLVAVAGAVGVAYVLVRHTSMDTSTEFPEALVSTGPEGTANADQVYECTAVPPVTVGTTAITFQAVGGSQSTPLTTKGDVYTFGAAPTRVGIGADNTIFIADSAQTTGNKWATISSALDAVIGSTRGMLLRRGASLWQSLALGASGQAVVSDGTDALWGTVGGGSGGGLVDLGIGTVTGSAATSLTVSGLNLGAYRSFLIFYALKDAAAGAVGTISLFYNSDTTVTDYNEQSLTLNGAAVTSARANDARMGNLDPNRYVTGFIHVEKDVNGRASALVFCNRDNSAGIVWQSCMHTWTTNFANVTSVTMSSSIANQLAVNSTFVVFGIAA